MNKVLEQAMAKLANLPEADQERISRKLIQHIDGLLALRADIQVGFDELDAGLGRPLDVEEFLARMHREYEAKT